MGIENEYFMFMYNALWGLFYIIVLGVITVSILFKHFEDAEFAESVAIYQLPYSERVKIAHLKYPETNNGIWELNDKDNSKSS
jgi:hypothetical protein